MSDKVWNGAGRPTEDESQRRAREFLRLVTEGEGWSAAAREVGFKTHPVLTLMDKLDFDMVQAALLDGRAQSVAVIVGHDQALEAA